MTDTIQDAGWEATLIRAGTIPMPGKLLAPFGILPEVVDLPSNVLLLRGHGRRLLVDTSAGGMAEEWEGATSDLTDALRTAGAMPDEIDTVILTHLDFDHCGGVIVDGRPAFANARVVATRQAVDWAREAGDPGAAAIREIAAAGLLDVSNGGEVAPGLSLLDAPGHRIGHSVLAIGAACYLADVVHHPLHVEHLDWDHEFDSDPEVALSTRSAMLTTAAGPVACSHIEGWATIERDGAALRWQPL
jgi:glyoxylase-like metal-dependent hydrolase (beta-lactamase superfamily II)